MNPNTPVSSEEIETFLKAFGLSGSESSYYLNTMQNRKGYHNMEHVKLMLSMLRELPSTLPKNLGALVLAILFHDYNYQLSATDNEEISAKSLLAHTNVSYQPKIVQDTVAIAQVLITRSVNPGKCPEDGLAKDNWDDILLMHDLDYAILGVGKTYYVEYALKVAHEYMAEYSAENYRKGRLKFLDKMIYEVENIFYLDYFKHLEERAVENMIDERSFLSGV